MPAFRNLDKKYLIDPEATRELNPWDRHPSEPTIWYDRFLTYCLLGPQRSLRRCWLHHRQTKNRSAPQRTPRTIPGSWTSASSQWQWVDRARAWDANEMAHSWPVTNLRTISSRRQHLERVQSLLTSTLAVFNAAVLPELSPAEARALLPSLRPLLRDLLYAERMQQRELENLPPQPRRTTFTADDMIAAQRRADEILAAARRDLEKSIVMESLNEAEHIAFLAAEKVLGFGKVDLHTDLTPWMPDLEAIIEKRRNRDNRFGPPPLTYKPAPGHPDTEEDDRRADRRAHLITLLERDSRAGSSHPDSSSSGVPQPSRPSPAGEG